MKSLLIILACVVVAGSAMAQTADTVNIQQTIVYGGVRYTNNVPNGSFEGVLGIATPLTGHLWGFATEATGKWGSLEGDVALITQVGTTHGWVGLLAGGGGDFTGGTTPVSYLTAAGGIVGGYWFNPHLGMWAGAKYKSSFGSDQFPEGWSSFTGLVVSF